MIGNAIGNFAGRRRAGVNWENSFQTSNIVLEGHSSLAGVIPLDHGIIDRLNVTSSYTAAVGGNTMDDVIARASVVDSKLVTEVGGLRNVLILYIGVNDFANTTGEGAVLYNKLKSYVAARINAGWKVFVYTMTPCTSGGRSEVFESERNIFNNLLRSDLAVISKVYILDSDTISELDDSTDVAFYSDLVHPTPEGAYLLSNLLITKVTELNSNAVKAIGEEIPFTLTATGDGTAVGRFVIQVSEITTITLTGSGKFYKDAVGTTGECDWQVIEPGADRTLYFKVTSGESICTFQHNKITRIADFVSSTNAPSLSGDIGKLINLTYFFTSSENIALSGNISLIPGLTHLVCKGTNTLSGSITGLPLTYIYVTGSNTLSGAPDPTKITFIWVEGNNTLSGDTSLWTLCYFIKVHGNNTLSYSRIINLQSLGYLYVHTSVTITSEIVNQLLADMLANKDYAKGTSSRTINLSGSPTSGAPTGQGITDKAALAAYRSPNNAAEYNLWTVTTR